MPATINPEKEADGLLEVLWPDRDTVPVDPVSIARALDIDVYEVSLSEPDVSGMLVKRPTERPQIYINATQHTHRKRFTCAHEIGHYVKRNIEGSDAFEYIDRRNHLSRTGVDADERWANQFAAALLMPAGYVRRYLPVHGHAGLAAELAVSMEAMGNRISNLRAAGRL